MSSITVNGKTFGSEDVLRAMAEFDKSRREHYSYWRLHAIKHNGLEYPPKEILRMIIHDMTGISGGNPTNKHFRALGFEVGERDGLDSAPDSPIEEAVDIAVSLERDLEDYLVSHLSQIEPGLKLLPHGNSTGRQVRAAEAGIIDILATDSKGTVVVLELKAGEGDRKALGQILAYMAWAQEQLAKGKPVRGMLVANEFTERVKLGAKVVPGLSLIHYSATFKFAQA